MVTEKCYDPAKLGMPYITHLKRYARIAKRGRGFTACQVKELRKQLVPTAIHAANGYIGGTALSTAMNGVTKQVWDTFIGGNKSAPDYYFK